MNERYVAASVFLAAFLFVGAFAVSDLTGGVVTKRSCIDDERLDYYVKDTVMYNGKEYNDGCIGTRVREYYCRNSRLYTKFYTCPKGFTCEDGACSADKTFKCVDADGDNYYYKTSITSSTGHVWWDQCILEIPGLGSNDTVQCSGSYCYLYEMLCEPTDSSLMESGQTFDGIYWVKVKCNSCKGGKCARGSIPTTNKPE